MSELPDISTCIVGFCRYCTNGQGLAVHTYGFFGGSLQPVLGWLSAGIVTAESGGNTKWETSPNTKRQTAKPQF